jgi:alanyl-tRNA synthetase
MKHSKESIILTFYSFMLSKGYKIENGQSLLSDIFPKTFTPSGGPDFAYKYLNGVKGFEGNNILVQTCIRHWDINAVGDTKHLSIFDMLVGYTIDGYDRTQLISDYMEFCIECLGLDKSRFLVSYFGGADIHGIRFEPDFEILDFWNKKGFDGYKVIKFEDNLGMEAFVANTVEPVGGSRAEIFYDLRAVSKPIKSVEEFLELDKKGEVLEFCTHVLYSHFVNHDDNDNFTFEKTKKDVPACGFGLERVLQILEKQNNINELSVFNSMNKVFQDVKKVDKETIHIINDHFRAVLSLIIDGVLDIQKMKNKSRTTIFNKYVNKLKRIFEIFNNETKEKLIDSLCEIYSKDLSVKKPIGVKQKMQIAVDFLKAKII